MEHFSFPGYIKSYVVVSKAVVLNLFQYMHPFQISSQFSWLLKYKEMLKYKVDVMYINNTTTFFLNLIFIHKDKKNFCRKK